MRNIKPSFLRLVQVIFLEEGKKILCLPRKLVTMNSKFERFSNVFFLFLPHTLLVDSFCPSFLSSRNKC